ncbi:GNAT family N-acetyltransferase [Paucibacter sp. M5-1]|uniref:GNAT family N-acetyltransferase n=1 Tax=Paucibacter sp. M5-1 TaxID=3015998 RepID=UPI0022B86AAC|nr:GNAT family N-acetyltransferase [Paucibacter sp. M5-1]MCZ7879628.1 GNAT family N-acetyltransferase [Paucibacter sp. M5-1]
MNITSVTSKAGLLHHRESIERLFFKSFGQRSLGEIWDWAYQRNPNGEPIVTLCYENDELVGHYAIVPMPLSNGDERKNSYISMTTMVAESHRKFGLFTQLAQENYAVATDLGVDFVFGFPNAQSTPGFRKRLNWQLPESDYVATVDKSALLALAETGQLEKAGRLGLDLTQPALREWRLSRPGATYTFENGLAYKRHGDALDLLWWEHTDKLAHLPEDAGINMLVEASTGLVPNRQFDYQFGGIGLRSTFDQAAIHREMAISDLF